MKSSLFYFSLLLGAGIVCFLSWLPNPIISSYGFFPHQVGHWVDADANINIRTAVPFLFMGLLAGVWLLFTRQAWQRWVGVFFGLVSIAFIAEAGQLWLPYRHLDWGDIGWGTAGALAGMALGAVFAYLVALLRPHTPIS